MDVQLTLARKLSPPRQRPTQAEQAARMPDGPAKQIILTKCVSCHTLDKAIDTRTLRIEANRNQWEEVMGTHMYYMEDRPQTMSYEEKAMIIDYMTKYFTQGAEADAPPQAPPAPPAAPTAQPP